MCNPISIGMFALSAGSSLASYGSQKEAARARNRARIRNYRLATDAYHRDVLLANADWKNSRTQTEIAIDNIFQQTADQWAQQDQTIAAVWDAEAFNQIDFLKKMFQSDTAREQTGVTAARIAAEPIREYGQKITKSYQAAIQKVDQAILQKEIWENDANRRRRVEWEKTWRSPVPGFAPEPEPLESMPGIGGTLLNIALAGVTSYIGGTALNKMNIGGGFDLGLGAANTDFSKAFLSGESLNVLGPSYWSTPIGAGANQLGVNAAFGGSVNLGITQAGSGAIGAGSNFLGGSLPWTTTASHYSNFGNVYTGTANWQTLTAPKRNPIQALMFKQLFNKST